MPERIQRKRTKGWRMPENTVYVGRGSRWGNRYEIGKPHPETFLPMTRDDVVALHRTLVHSWTSGIHRKIQSELGGKNLACWCPLNQPCHADVLLELANAAAGTPKGAG